VSFLQRKIEKVIIEGDVTDPNFSSPLEWGLYACSRAYETAVRFRIHLYEGGICKQKSLPCKVVSIGNMTVGGTGKTPMVEYVAKFLKKLGLEVSVISRGYKGRAQHSGGLVANGKTLYMGPEGSGDEPQLLASRLKGIPVLVGKDRYRVGMHSINRFGTSVLVLDDAFQHLPLKRDVNLLLLDSVRPFGNGHCLPRGPLREPVEQTKRASAFILTRWPGDNDSTRVSPIIETLAEGRPIFRSVHVPDGLFLAGQEEPVNFQELKRKRLFLFSGIARNDSFRETVSNLQGHVEDFLAFPDHHRYSYEDLKLIWRRAGNLKVDNIITTEKDYVNIRTQIPSVPKLMVLTVSISFQEDKEAFEGFLRSRVSNA
jgi:tetraacyldisaccharide 4'-kinase